MKIIICLVPVIFLLISCDRNPLFLRLGAEYFPVSCIGSEWDYSLGEGAGNVIITVVGQTIIGERNAYKVQTGADYSYWSDDEETLLHFEDHNVLFNGDEVMLYQGWMTYLKWPLATGNSWEDSINAFETVQGVTISHSWNRTTEVIGLGNINSYENCYHVRQLENTINWIQSAGFSPETISVENHMWLAPDVGVVYRTTPDSTLILQSYQPGQ